MRRTIECCLNNVDAETRRTLSASDCSVVAATCLEHCGHCHRSPFLVVDGEFRTGEDHAALLDGSSVRTGER